MNFESLIFDIDGTLWDSRALVAEGYNLQLRDEGYAHLCVSAEILKPLFGKTTDDIADIIFPSVPAPQRYALIRRCMEREFAYMQEIECRVGYPKVKETLEILARKHRLFIVSNSDAGYPELCMEKLGITHLIQGTLCHGQTGTGKGETIKKLMADHGIRSACYIGDIQGDLEAAEQAGVPFIHCAYGFGTADHCWQSIQSFEELLTLPNAE